MGRQFGPPVSPDSDDRQGILDQRPLFRLEEDQKIGINPQQESVGDRGKVAGDTRAGGPLQMPGVDLLAAFGEVLF